MGHEADALEAMEVLRDIGFHIYSGEGPIASCLMLADHLRRYDKGRGRPPTILATHHIVFIFVGVGFCGGVLVMVVVVLVMLLFQRLCCFLAFVLFMWFCFAPFSTWLPSNLISTFCDFDFASTSVWLLSPFPVSLGLHL